MVGQNYLYAVSNWTQPSPVKLPRTAAATLHARHPSSTAPSNQVIKVASTCQLTQTSAPHATNKGFSITSSNTFTDRDGGDGSDSSDTLLQQLPDTEHVCQQSNPAAQQEACCPSSVTLAAQTSKADSQS
ncbi:MAG: hypothetical protein WDW36_007189 [Sanguina aurantia]